MLIARRLVTAAGLALLIGAAVLMLWPLHANGVSGNALRPHYTDFGFYSYVALPAHPTHGDFARAGITIPQQVVDARRKVAAEIAGSGVILTIGAVALRRRRTATEASPPTR